MMTRNADAVSFAAKTLFTTLLFALALATATQAATNTVTITADSGASSLRATIASSASGDTITFDPSLSGQTIILTNGQLTVDKDLTIDASALADGISISGNANTNGTLDLGESRIFEIPSGRTVRLCGLRLINGQVSTTAGNNSAFGGAVLNSGTLTLERCLVTNCFARYGGGIENMDTLTLNNATLSGNSANYSGSGIFSEPMSMLTLSNAIVAGNSNDNIEDFGFSTDNGHNLTSGDPKLAPLGDYGGPTQTMPPLPGSPAIDAGGSTSLTTDQRGFPRVVGSAVDIGAVEFQAGISYYAGNGDTGFGGAIGQGTLLLTNDGYNITGTIHRGPGNFNDNFVLYIDSIPGGVSDSSGFADADDQLRKAISGFDGRTNRSTMIFQEPVDYAIALGPKGAAFGGLWRLTNGGSGSLEYVTNVNLSPPTNNATTYTFSFPVNDIGLTPGGGGVFRLFGTYISDSGYRSTEALPGEVSGVQGWNTFTNTAMVDYAIRGSPLVLNTNDNGPGSLRQVVYESASGSTVEFTNTLSSQTITLSNGQITVDKNLTIDASALAIGPVVSGNHANRVMLVETNASVSITALTISGGNADNGAGILNLGDLSLFRCTLTSNAVSNVGAGLLNGMGAVMTVQNCTLSGNTSTNVGAGIFNDVSGTLRLNNSTLSANAATISGGAIYNHGLIFATNSIVAGNMASSGANLTNFVPGTFSGINNLTSGDPQLAPLGDYGGPTPTMPPLPGSPAIDAGGSTTLTTDQRGFARVVNGTVDIGAVEGVFNPNFSLISPTQLGNGMFQFSFNNLNGASFRVLATTNLALPASWMFIGFATEAPPGTFTFTDTQATNSPQHFYRVESP